MYNSRLKLTSTITDKEYAKTFQDFVDNFTSKIKHV